MPKLVMMPPLDELKIEFAKRLPADLPEYQVVVPETVEEARREIGDADAAYGWIPPDLLPLAGKLHWLQNPDAGPVYGYYYEALTDHPVVICNPRGIYNDHISQHIMMFLLALAQGLPFYVEAQRQRRWEKDARPGPGPGPDHRHRADLRGRRDRPGDGAALPGVRDADHRRGPALGARGARRRAPHARRA